ncbi:PREDICTED: uncharacterized protein LOC105570554 [Vollenhovia emeryi]|uniref:uncharacterized protein LOC105570554 n=1 Tax=Vollenhovia emeryi TaxID=411798 RepID=UPI0005F45941|nr:PREDICTED: uncharacterized protein LOC105570554 [Vollenhovia emeryi]
MCAMEWIVVHFIDENVVEAVPKLWLHDNLCYWPPYTGNKLRNAMNTCEKPVFGSWPLFKVRELGDGQTYDDFQKAKSKASVAEDTSDLASDVEGKRIRKKKKFLYSTNETQSEENETESEVTADYTSSDSEVHPTKFPMLSEHTEIDINTCMSPKPCTSTIVASSKEINPKPRTSKIGASGAKEINPKRGINKIGTSAKVNPKPFTSEKATSAKEIITDNNNDKENVLEPTTLNKNKTRSLHEIITSNSKDNMNCHIDKTDTDAAFKKQVLRQLQIINLRQSQLWEDVQTILQKIQVQDDRMLITDNEETIFNKFDFPLKSIDELNAVEEHLMDKTNTNMFVKELTKIGGATYKHAIKRIMCNLFSNEVAQTYSWIGFKGKNKFSLLQISACIIKAVQKIHNTITLCDIEAAIKAWLVKAKLRNAKKEDK